MYPATGFLEMKNTRQPVQIQNISRTGIQFSSNNPIPKNVQFRLMWQDAKFGALECCIAIVRDITVESGAFQQFCYGSKFVNLKDDLQKNINRLVETTQDFERQTEEKLLEKTSYVAIGDVMVHGRAFLRDLIKGRKQGQGVIDQIAKELKDYEKQSFDRDDVSSQWIQKMATQCFHSRILMVVLVGTNPKSVRSNTVHKMVTDKLQSMSCLIAECQKFLDTDKSQTGYVMGRVKETLNRLTYHRIELSEVLFKQTGGRLS